ncbi:MAG TPA: helix-turn-helix transcriptional regulator [Candidatus Aquilonibacter sp.]|nr:helix-turn-helix transcriptional regulator [Candidatus Aquilonibacter sp.]
MALLNPDRDAERRAELSDFLRTRRARLTPEDVGLVSGSRRRTPGLRREEVALLANIGATWYTRLEQGLPINVSPDVLESIGKALHLTDVERHHLFTLAGVAFPERNDTQLEAITPQLRRVIDAMYPHPAYVRGRRWDILAANKAAEVVLGIPDVEHGPKINMLYRFFTNYSCRSIYPSWDEIGPKLVAQFRAIAARYPDDEGFRSLISTLAERSEHFRRWWAQHDVVDVTQGFKRFYHPSVGELTLDHVVLAVPDFADVRVIAYSVEPGSDSERKLHRLVAMPDAYEKIQFCRASPTRI